MIPDLKERIVRISKEVNPLAIARVVQSDAFKLASLWHATRFLPDTASTTERVYCVANDVKDCPACVVCGKPTTWNPRQQAYRKTCGQKCAAIYHPIKDRKASQASAAAAFIDYLRKVVDTSVFDPEYAARFIRENCLADYELLRFCAEKDTVVIGGASRLLEHFSRGKEGLRLVSYANRRFSSGGLYQRLGFVEQSISRLNYYWVKGGRIWHRMRFQKYRLASILPEFDPAKTEVENMFNAGYRRIWDYGYIVYSKTM